MEDGLLPVEHGNVLMAAQRLLVGQQGIGASALIPDQTVPKVLQVTGYQHGSKRLHTHKQARPSAEPIELCPQVAELDDGVPRQGGFAVRWVNQGQLCAPCGQLWHTHQAICVIKLYVLWALLTCL
jgi:hypothetical protein